jgi:hypothetical protein
MRICEVADLSDFTPKPNELMGLVSFLSGRADDTNAQKQISQQAFISLAQSLDINVNAQNIAELVGQPPLSNLLEPLAPESTDPIVFKGGGEPTPVKMPVNQAQNIVAAAAKSAANKDRGV